MAKKILGLAGLIASVIGIAILWIVFFASLGYSSPHLMYTIFFTLLFVGTGLIGLLSFLEKSKLFLAFGIISGVLGIEMVFGPNIFGNGGYSISMSLVAGIAFIAVSALSLIRLRKANLALTIIPLITFVFGTVFALIPNLGMATIAGIILLVIAMAAPFSLVYEGGPAPIKRYSPNVDKDSVIIDKTVEEGSGETRYWEENGFRYANRP